MKVELQQGRWVRASPENFIFKCDKAESSDGVSELGSDGCGRSHLRRS